MRLHESGRLRFTLGMSLGSGISFGIRMPMISGHDQEHRATMVLENEIW